MKVRLGTRGSNLAMWQATAVYNHLKQQGISSEIVPLTSKGDRSLGGQLSTRWVNSFMPLTINFY